MLLQDLVAEAQARCAGHERFPGGRLRNFVTYTKVDLEARCEVERLAGSRRSGSSARGPARRRSAGAAAGGPRAAP